MPHDQACARHPLPGIDRNRPRRRKHASQSPPTRPHDGQRPHPVPTHDKGSQGRSAAGAD
ncbi:hypothetical protein [Streptomyces sp. NPDC050355]|uniref:hypothetical protein n=1 Tax=Streptomyces sp. NPDC050355 TaxID=3365609 RepID=UPI0037BC6297